MNNRSLNIIGVTLQKELQLGFLFGGSFVLWLGFIYIYYRIYNLNDFTQIPTLYFLMIMVIALGVSLYFFRFSGKIMRTKLLFTLDDDQISIKYKFDTIHFNFNKIKEISLVGTSNSMRYFKIISEHNTIKICLGTYSLTSFSSNEDILIMDSIMEHLVDKLKKTRFQKLKSCNP